MSNEGVCVGVDGSKPSEAALMFAIDAAKRLKTTLQVVTAWKIWTGYDGHDVGPSSDDRQRFHRQAAAVQSTAIEVALREVTDPPEVVRHVVWGVPGDVLVDAAEDCYLLVVGTEHKGVLKRAVLGSTSAHCTRYSRIPVVVVPFVNTRAAADDTDGPDQEVPESDTVA